MPSYTLGFAALVSSLLSRPEVLQSAFTSSLPLPFVGVPLPLFSFPLPFLLRTSWGPCGRLVSLGSVTVDAKTVPDCSSSRGGEKRG